MAVTMAGIRAALRAKGKAKAAGTWHGFDALVEKLGRRRGVRSPRALVASIGRKKFGRRNFAAMGVAGKMGLSGD